MRKGFTLVEMMAVIAVIGILCCMVCGKGCWGVGGCGPRRDVKHATVTRMYVDHSGGKHGGSAYMVGTDKGVFEVDNGILLGMWNADELYSALKEGRTYDFVTKGETIQNWMMQEYPRIVKAVAVQEPEK